MFHSERTKPKLETASVYLTDAILGTIVLSEDDVTSATSVIAFLMKVKFTSASFAECPQFAKNTPRQNGGEQLA